jgi:[amino group carrier protein]-lysine/ornithine hydrolase
VLDAIELLKTAISIPSVSTHETEIAHYLVSQMKTFANEAFVDASGSAVAKVGHGALKVIFLGHIDTVPGDIPVRIEDGKLYGRGSVDAKGPFCTAVAAASRLSDEVRSKLTLTLIGATEEEASSSKGARHAMTAYPKPDLVIIGEPSNWDAITLGYKGRLIVKAVIEKDHFHSAGEGTTAAEDVVNVWNALKQHSEHYNKDKQGVFDQVQIALQGVSSQLNGFKQKAEATIGYRLPLAVTPEGLEQEIQALLPNVELFFFGREIAYRSEKDTPLTRALRVAIREEGGTPRFKVKTGTADMNVVAPYWNVPMVAYGPGDSALDHTPKEHVDLVEYEKAIAVLASALTHLSERVTNKK